MSIILYIPVKYIIWRTYTEYNERVKIRLYSNFKKIEYLKMSVYYTESKIVLIKLLFASTVCPLAHPS
jgi:hypothetical protein